MSARLSLTVKIGFLATINVLLLTAVLVAFATVQFRLDLESFLVAPARDRILATSRLLALELAETAIDEREALLEAYSDEYGVRFHLVNLNGTGLIGPSVELPPQVVERLPRRRGARAPRLSISATSGRGPVFMVATSNPTRYWAGVRIPVLDPTGATSMSAVLLLVSDSLLGNQFFFDPNPWLAITLVVILVSLAVWLPLIRGVTRSITQMTRATARIAEGQFDVLVTATRKDEVGQLASSINRMSGQLAGFVRGQKRFLADIAHELSSPIARMQMALGILDQRVEDKQREHVADVQEEAEHISGLINELLSFSKVGMLFDDAKLVPVNVADIVRRVLEREALKDSDIKSVVEDRLKVLAEPGRLFRALANLVRNATRYAGEAGPIEIQARLENDDIVITVADSGPGVPEDTLEDLLPPPQNLWAVQRPVRT